MVTIQESRFTPLEFQFVFSLARLTFETQQEQPCWNVPSLKSHVLRSFSRGERAVTTER